MHAPPQHLSCCWCDCNHTCVRWQTLAATLPSGGADTVPMRCFACSGASLSTSDNLCCVRLMRPTRLACWGRMPVAAATASTSRCVLIEAGGHRTDVRGYGKIHSWGVLHCRPASTATCDFAAFEAAQPNHAYAKQLADLLLCMLFTLSGVVWCWCLHLWGRNCAVGVAGGQAGEKAWHRPGSA